MTMRVRTTLRGAETVGAVASRDERARVIVIEGAARGSKFVVENGMTLGRGRSASVHLDADDISRLHARIHVDGVYTIADLGSRNGTFLNDIPVEGATLLRFGDRIRIGAHTILLFTHYDPAEAELLKRHRLELLGRMSAGIVHDVNNLLGALLSTQEYLLETPPDTPLGDAETRECMLEIKAAGEQAAHLMPKLLSFARGHSEGHRRFDVSLVCEEVMQIVRRTFDRRIRVAANVEPNLTILGDRVELQQVLMNLCVNARDAMSDGGDLTINVHTVEPASPNERRTVQIDVADTGDGMDEHTRERIFEPFFTTKSEGRGSGLGLATAKEMVTIHGGQMWVTSAKGEGSVFTIRLPLDATMGPEVHTLAPPCDDDPVAKADILLVDDDPFCRKAFARLLRRMGHQVTVAVDGPEALRVLKRVPHPPDVVLLDVDMPELSGEETLRMMRYLVPDLWVIAITGNRDAVRQQAMLDGGARQLLAKPFTQDTLSAAVAKALAALIADEPTTITYTVD